MATGIRIGWRKLMTLAAAQITAATMMTRRTTKQAVSAAHIVLRCQGVGYCFMWRLSRSLRRFRFGKIFADSLFGALLLLRMVFVFRVESQGFLPGFQFHWHSILFQIR